MFHRVRPASFDAFEDVRLGLFPETVQSRDFACLASLLELLDGINPELLVEDLDFLGTDPRDFEHLREAGRD